MERLRPLLILLILMLCSGLRAQDGSVDLSFNASDPGYGNGSSPNASVDALLVLSNDRVLIAGRFTSYNGGSHPRIACLDPEGKPATGFNPGTGPDLGVLAMALQADGKILIGGAFWNYNGTNRARLARLNADGTLDTSFDPGTAANDTVRDILVQPDGKILVVGKFTTFNGAAANRIVRLDPNGTIDPGFTSGTGAGALVRTCALLSNGKIMIGGDFNTYNGSTRNKLARLNADGTLDTSYNPANGMNGLVADIAVQPDGKLVVAGGFSMAGVCSRNSIARLQSDGICDATFNSGSGANMQGRTVLVQPDGKVLFGGYQTTVNGTSARFLARLNANGSLDAGFTQGAGGPTNVYDGSYVAAIGLQSDGRIIGAGLYSWYQGWSVGRLVRLTSTGALDPSFNAQSGASGRVWCAAMQTDGKIVLAGGFPMYNNAQFQGLVRTFPNGDIDPSFNIGTGVHGYVSHMVLQADGKMVIAGAFYDYNDIPRSHIARINTDGTLDTTFDPGSGLNNVPSALALCGDGKIIVTGYFTTYNGVPRNRVARLNTDGSLDTSFDIGTGPNDVVLACATQADGKVLVSGYFNTWSGSLRDRWARLNADGTLDTGMGTPWVLNGLAGGTVLNMLPLPDGKIMMAGTFQSNAGNYVVRLNNNGTADPSFNTGTGPNTGVRKIFRQADGKLIIAGLFSSVNGVGRTWLARLHPNGVLDTSFDCGTGPNSTNYVDNSFFQDQRMLVQGELTAFNGIGRNGVVRLNNAVHRVAARIMLEGPFANGSMSDVLRTLPEFPRTEPFSTMGYAEAVYTSGAGLVPSALATTGPDAIVDWVILELRPATQPGTVAASRAVLLQRDGDVVDLDGVSNVAFSGLSSGNYCVVVKPRNHLPVMLSPSTPFAYGTSNATVDFALPSTQVYDADARKNVGGVMLLRAGDVTFNEALLYVGAGNDRDPILVRIGGSTPTATLSGYYPEDVNMDGVVKYVGTANDRDPILLNIGGTNPTATTQAQLP